MHCLHVSSVAGSLRSLNCGNATGLCSGVCLETLANPGNHGASVVLLDRTFRAPGSNPELFFFHTLFSAESHAGPPIKGRKTVFILARHQVCTVHEKSRNQSHRPGSRLGMVESGSGSGRSWPRGAGPLHHWWRHLLGWRAATMRKLACQHGSEWPTTGK